MFSTDSYNNGMIALARCVRDSRDSASKDMLQAILNILGGTISGSPESAALFDAAVSGKPVFCEEAPKKDSVASAWNPSEDGPKVTMEFVLPHHEEQLRECMDASAIKCLLWDLLQEIRTSVKHGTPFNGMKVSDVYDKEPTTAPGVNDAKVETLEQVRAFVVEAAQNRSIRLD